MEKEKVAFALYVVLGAAALVVLWRGDFAWISQENERASKEGVAFPPSLTGVSFVDLPIEFLCASVPNEIAASLFLSLFAFGQAVIWGFMAEASRRSCAVNPVLTCALPLLSHFVGVSIVLPAFLAVLNKSAERNFPRGIPLYEIPAARAFNLLALGFLGTVGSTIAIPLTAENWGESRLDSSVVAAFIFVQTLPPFFLLFDGTRQAQKSVPWNTGSPKMASFQETEKLQDREFAHIAIMVNSGLVAFFGLIIHIKAWYTIFVVGASAAFAQLFETWLTTYLFMDYLILVIVAYVWLELEARRPLTSSSHLRSAGDGDEGLLQWRDLPAVILFGPICHFSTAFLARELGLMQLDNLRLKSN